MWEFLSEVLKSGGVLALMWVVQMAAIVYLYRAMQAKDKQLLEMSEKRLNDAIENKEDIEEMSKNLQLSLDLLIKIFKKE